MNNTTIDANDAKESKPKRIVKTIKTTFIPSPPVVLL